MASLFRVIFHNSSVQASRLEKGSRLFQALGVVANDSTCFRTYSAQPLYDPGQPTSETHPQLLAAGEITPGITEHEYKERRRKLLAMIPEGGLIIIGSAPVKMMTDVVPYHFRQDADYSYITGCQQPGGVAVLNSKFGLCMFMPDSDPEKETWWGKVADTSAALNVLKADQAHPISKLNKLLPDMISKASSVYHSPRNVIARYTDLPPFKKAAMESKVHDVRRYTHELRWIKSPSEINIMRQSAAIACQALLKTMLTSRTYPNEHILAATFEFESKIRGAQRMAFTPVVGSGTNATTIHYSRNDKHIKESEMVLMDAGCELHGYVSDITRTWPPYGTYSPYQQELYGLILDTSNKCLKLCKPGMTLNQIHDYSVQLLRKGLSELGILKGTPFLPDSFQQFNPTSVGHYLGLDVHDCSSISYRRPLQPGVIITIEPGVYIPENSNVPERFKGIGIRIEDDVLITETGCEVLSSSLPKEIKEVQSLLHSNVESLNRKVAFQKLNTDPLEK